jgi:hypothetical protein
VSVANHDIHSTLNLGLCCLTVSKIVELDVGYEVVLAIKELSPVLFKHKADMLNQIKSQMQNATAHDPICAKMHE